MHEAFSWDYMINGSILRWFTTTLLTFINLTPHCIWLKLLIYYYYFICRWTYACAYCRPVCVVIRFSQKDNGWLLIREQLNIKITALIVRPCDSLIRSLSTVETFSCQATHYSFLKCFSPECVMFFCSYTITPPRAGHQLRYLAFSERAKSGLLLGQWEWNIAGSRTSVPCSAIQPWRCFKSPKPIQREIKNYVSEREWIHVRFIDLCFYGACPVVDQKYNSQDWCC